MRILWWVLLMSLSMPAVAFNVGGTSRTNFGTSNTEVSQEDTTAPRTYTATTYSSRYKFDKGVQTRGVQTKPVDVVGNAQNEIPPAVVEEPIVTISVNKKQAKNVPPPPAEKPTPAAAAAQQETPAEIPPEATAAMAQLGQMQEMLQGLQNMAGSSGGSAQGNNAGAMPAGMPDLSALMGGKAPEKK